VRICIFYGVNQRETEVEGNMIFIHLKFWTFSVYFHVTGVMQGEAENMANFHL
jgi:hypothetical protein